MDWQDIHQFWFGKIINNRSYYQERNKLWFFKNKETDDFIRKSFGHLLDKFDMNKFESWKSSPKSYVSLIILLDQFPRNIFRNSPQSYVFDSHALNLCKEVISIRAHDNMNVFEQSFAFLPLEHSEDIEDQKLSVKLFTLSRQQNKDANLDDFLELNLDYAIKHKEIIERFGRFPHRNNVLNRESTPEELEFLTQPGSSF